METAVRSRAALFARSARSCGRLPGQDSEGVEGGEQKPIEIGWIAIAKMAYGIMVWVLILMRMILRHYDCDPDPKHALASRIQY